MNRRLWIAGIIATFLTMSCAVTGERVTGERLTSEELLNVLVGNTEEGKIDIRGTMTTYVEFYRKDGIIIGRDEGKYKGKWEIRENGCAYANYDDTDEYDGCYYYVHISGDKYYQTGVNNFASEIIIFEGDPRKLNSGY